MFSLRKWSSRSFLLNRRILAIQKRLFHVKKLQCPYFASKIISKILIPQWNRTMSTSLWNTRVLESRATYSSEKPMLSLVLQSRREKLTNAAKASSSNFQKPISLKKFCNEKSRQVLCRGLGTLFKNPSHCFLRDFECLLLMTISTFQNNKMIKAVPFWPRTYKTNFRIINVESFTKKVVIWTLRWWWLKYQIP